MGRENGSFASNGEGLILTRARAKQEKPPIQQSRRISRANTKRAALDENNTGLLDDASNKHKRRAVLGDVTNVCCESSHRILLHAAKSQANNIKQTKKARCNEFKVAVSTDGKAPRPKANSKSVREATETEVKCEESQSSNVKDLSMDVVNRPPKRNYRITLHGSPEKDKYTFFKDKMMYGEYTFFKDKMMYGEPEHEPSYTDIDCDHNNAQLCSIYAPDIYSNLRFAELLQRPQALYMETKQKDITQSMRGILVDWLVEVSDEYKLAPDTLYLSVYLIDRYLSQNCIVRPRLQLLGITCMLIASKYEEMCAPRVEEFCFITDNTYTKPEVLKMETQVLKSLGFQIFTPTAKTFLRRYLRAAQTSYKSPTYELEYLANYLTELTLVNYDFLNFPPSIIAASAVFLAKWTLDQTSHPWTPTLEHYTSYKALNLKTSVLALRELQLNSSGCPLVSVRMKYAQQKFMSVAALLSPKLLETLF